MKAYFKTILRLFKKHISRFFSISLIVFVSVGFTSGVGASPDRIRASLTDYYITNNVSDVIIKSTSQDGFTTEEISLLEEKYSQQNINYGLSVDVNMKINEEDQIVRLYFYNDLENITVNRLKEIETYQEIGSEIYGFVEQKDNKLKGIELGSTITLDFKDIFKQLAEQNNQEITSQIDTLLNKLQKKEVIISKTVANPLTFSLEGEPSYKNEEDTKVPVYINEVNKLITLDNIFYLPYSLMPTYKDIYSFLGDDPLIKTGDIYLSLPNRNMFNSFADGYKEYLDEQIEELKTVLKNPENLHFITLYDNFSFYSLDSYCDKVEGLSILLMIVFLLITALVVYSSMSRLLEEERAQIACLTTLGYSPFKIISRYALFALTATIIGGVIAYFIGVGLCSFIYYVFNYSYAMPELVGEMLLTFFFITFGVILLTIILTTFLVGHSLTNKTPATLLRPKAPKNGKKVILEKIPFIWKRLSFKYKSTLRNVLRYKSRFIMTIVSIGGAMGLNLAGLALLDLCLFKDFGSAAIIGLAILIVVFAGLLTIVVIYTLTNINISERNREIATLMVLGYYDEEVSRYIYREIYINTIIGILFGYLAGLFLVNELLNIVGFGTMSDVTWYVWVIGPFIILFFTFLVTIILRRKIISIKMNESLKSIE